MNQNPYIDYHIDIKTLLDFANEQIESGKMTSDEGKIIFKCLKQVVLNAELKPFLEAPKDLEDPYYNKYVRLESETLSKLIPDFFSSNGDFYDLQRPYFVNRIEADDDWKIQSN